MIVTDISIHKEMRSLFPGTEWTPWCYESVCRICSVAVPDIPGCVCVFCLCVRPNVHVCVCMCTSLTEREGEPERPCQLVSSQTQQALSRERRSVHFCYCDEVTGHLRSCQLNMYHCDCHLGNMYTHYWRAVNIEAFKREHLLQQV